MTIPAVRFGGSNSNTNVGIDANVLELSVLLQGTGQERVHPTVLEHEIGTEVEGELQAQERLRKLSLDTTLASVNEGLTHTGKFY